MDTDCPVEPRAGISTDRDAPGPRHDPDGRASVPATTQTAAPQSPSHGIPSQPQTVISLTQVMTNVVQTALQSLMQQGLFQGAAIVA